MNQLAFNNVSFSYNRKNAVFNSLSFSFENKGNRPGYCIALMGSSGSGKTTLLKLLLKTLLPQQGNIEYSPGKPVISYVPQEPVLFEHLSPMRNASYLSEVHFYKKLFSRKVFNDLCGLLGMEEVLSKSKSVKDLSGGQKQRISLIRALSVAPDIILLDEPATGLDSIVKLSFLQNLRQIVSQTNVLSVYVTHHRLERELVADEVAFLGAKTMQGISSIHQMDLQSFIKKPPVLEAVRIFDYPSANIIKYVANGNNIRLGKYEDSQQLQFALRPENIKLVTNEGIGYQVISSNPVYSAIQVNNQLLTLPTSPALFMSGTRLRFTGELLSYDGTNNLSGIVNADNYIFLKS